MASEDKDTIEPSKIDTIWELEHTDAFQKAKRIALLFASAALIVSLNEAVGSPAISVLSTTVSLDSVVIWWSFFIATAYYSYAAYHEYQVLLERSRPFAIEFGQTKLHEAFDRIRDYVLGSVEHTDYLASPSPTFVEPPADRWFHGDPFVRPPQLWTGLQSTEEQRT